MSKISLLKNINLLLVEDDEDLIYSLKETLSIFFKDILIAKNGKEALKIYSNNTVDLIITDYVMPNMNGYELCKEIRKQNEKIPLIIMSNFSDTEKLLKSITLELTEYLIKPIEYKQLLESLLKVVDKLERKNVLNFIINENCLYNFFTKELFDKSKNVNIKLTKSEISILELLINNINKVVNISEIEFNLSPNEPKSEQAIKNIIHRLRTKISKNSISNIQGIGYILKKESNV